MSIGHARERVLRDYINNTPGGAKRLAEAAVSCIPWAALKDLTEALDLEFKAQEIKRNS